MGFLPACDRFSYGQRSKCADLLNSYHYSQNIPGFREKTVFAI
jgi:hypothetical protein